MLPIPITLRFCSVFASCGGNNPPPCVSIVGSVRIMSAFSGLVKVHFFCSMICVISGNVDFGNKTQTLLPLGIALSR